MWGPLQETAFGPSAVTAQHWWLQIHADKREGPLAASCCFLLHLGVLNLLRHLHAAHAVADSANCVPFDWVAFVECCDGVQQLS